MVSGQGDVGFALGRQGTHVVRRDRRFRCLAITPRLRAPHPRGSNRIYAFGTQAIPGLVGDPKLGLYENAPIGFRYSDNDGHTWSPVELIKPVSDPEFRGMSCVRMCETNAGTWLIGSHDGVWSIPHNPQQPVTTRQYVLRSADRGQTWTIAPGARPNGWFVKPLDRMDEGTVLALPDGSTVMFVRTAEGHVWETRSATTAALGASRSPRRWSIPTRRR